MGEKLENLRLRLITDDDSDDDDDDKSLNKKDGTKKDGTKKGGREKNCCLYSLINIGFVLVLFAVLLFIALKVMDIQKVLKKKENDTCKKSGNQNQKKNELENTIPGSDFCKSVNADNMTMVALGYLKGTKEGASSMDAKNQMYYVTNRMFTDQEACTIEALLRLCQDKSIFIVEMGNMSSANNTAFDYIAFLRKQYTNLNLIKSTPQMFFKGSPFENYITYIDDLSVFAAKVLLVWQFGGTVLSPNFLLLTRRMFDSNEGFCEVDRELLFCPNQCSAYVYELVKITLNMLKSGQNLTSENVIENAVDKSVIDYCGDPDAVTIGCVGINRIKPYNICHKPNKMCDFLRVQEWKVKDRHWKTIVQKFCPKIVAKFIPEISQNETVPLEIVDYN